MSYQKTCNIFLLILCNLFLTLSGFCSESPQPQPAGNVQVSSAPVPDLSLTPEQMRENLETVCREIPRTYQALEAKKIPWADICDRYREKIQKVSKTPDFYYLMFQLAAELKNTHVFFENFPFTYLDYGVGASCRCDPTGTRAFVVAVKAGSPAQKAGLSAGTEIIEVDGQSIADRISYISQFRPGESTLRVRNLGSCQILFQANDRTPAHVTYINSEGKKAGWRIPRSRRQPSLPLPLPPLPGNTTDFANLTYARTPENFGVIRFKTFHDRTGTSFDEYQHALAGLHDVRGLIFDLRGNPGGTSYLPNRIIRTLIKEKKLVLRNKVHQLNGTWQIKTEYLDPDTTNQIGVPVVAITDETSQSVTELLAQMLAYTGIPRVGRTTAGLLGGWARYLDLPCGLRLRVEYGDALMPDDTSVEGNGVPPDHAVPDFLYIGVAVNDKDMEAATALLSAQ